jgi:hypothetical protein
MTTPANIKERRAALKKLPPLLTDEVLSVLTLAAIAASAGDAQHGAIRFVVTCHEIAGRTPPDFSRFDE